MPKLPCTYSRGLIPSRSRTRDKLFVSSSHNAKANIPWNLASALSKPSASIASSTTSVSEEPRQSMRRPCSFQVSANLRRVVDLTVVGDAVATRSRPHRLPPRITEVDDRKPSVPETDAGFAIEEGSRAVWTAMHQGSRHPVDPFPRRCPRPPNPRTTILLSRTCRFVGPRTPSRRAEDSRNWGRSHPKLGRGL